MRFVDTIDIAAPIERLWALTENVEAWPSFSPTMTSIERLDGGPLMIGSRARIKQPAQRPAVWTVTRFEPGRAFAWQAGSLGMTMVGSHEIEPSAAGCVNTLTLELSGTTSKVLGLLLGRVLRTSLRRENAAFRSEAERLDS